MHIKDIIELTKRYERLEKISESLTDKLKRLDEETKGDTKWIKSISLIISDGNYDGEEISFGGLAEVMSVVHIKTFVLENLDKINSEMKEIKEKLEK